MNKRFSILAFAVLLTACTPQSGPVVTPASAQTSTTPSPAASQAPATATPSEVPSASPSVASFSLTSGEVIGAGQLTNPAGIFYEAGTGTLYVSDAETTSIVSPRYLLRRFKTDGTATGAFQLAPDGGTPPTAVDAVAFQLRGTPIYAYRKDDAFQLLKLATATVTVGDRYPLFDLKKAGVVALGNKGDVLFEAAVAFDPDKTEKTNGSLYFAQSEEDKTPKALFSIPDPFTPTTRMAFNTDGELYLAGPNPGGGLGLKRLAADQSLKDVPITLGSVPDGLWVGPGGDLYMSYNSIGSPAKVRRYGADGKFKGETEVKLKNGGFLDNIRGLAFDAQGTVYMTASGYDPAGTLIRAMVRF